MNKRPIPQTFEEWLEQARKEPLHITPAVTDTLPPPEFAFTEPESLLRRARTGVRRIWRFRFRHVTRSADAPVR